MSKITNTTRKFAAEWLFGGNPGAIVAQEKNGRAELVASQQLPVKVNSPTNLGRSAAEQYEIMGIKVLGPTNDDKLFHDVELPDGWSIKETNHVLWSDLVDNKGHRRATLFYKAAFYDRDAFVDFIHFITISIGYSGSMDGDYSMDENNEYNYHKTPYIGRVTGGGEILFQTPETMLVPEYQYDGHRRGYTEQFMQKNREAEAACKQMCLDFVNINYPDYEDVNAYWDEPF